jgi:tetratricopeptide (TPR) repeat protein
MNNKSLIIIFWLLLLSPSISFAQEGYYRLGQEKLEFRLTVENVEEAKEKADWEELTDRENKRFFVSKEVGISSDDIDGVFVQKTGFDDTFEILIFFKKESWNKIHDITSHNIKKRLGIVRRGKLLMAPEIFEALDTKASIVGNISASEVEWFVKGFTRMEELSEEKAIREKEENKRFRDELVKKIANNPDDIVLQIRLASEYFFGNPKDYRKAADLYENIIKKDPSRADISSFLAECYASFNEYEKAIKVLEQVITINPTEEFIARIQLADVYKRWGQADSALNELEKSLKILNSSSKENKEQWLEALKNMIEEIKKESNKP